MCFSKRLTGRNFCVFFIPNNFNFFRRIFIILTITIIYISLNLTEARSRQRGGKRTGGKSNLQFAQVAEFSLISKELTDNRVTKIILFYFLIL